MENFPVTLEKGGIDPSEVEKELRRIWRETAELDTSHADSPEGATPRVRATLSNVVLLFDGITSSTKEHRKVIDPFVAELCISHPSRFFMITLTDDKDQQSAVDTAVASRCVVARSGSHICSEEIYLKVGVEGVPVVKNLLYSLLVADIPTVVLCAGDISDIQSPFFNLLGQVEGVGDRFIYDSRFFTEYGKSLQTLELLRSHRGDSPEATRFGERCEVDARDVNWQRLSRWRDLVAEQFESPRFIDNAKDISSVRVYCNVSAKELAKGHVPGGALLFAGWLMNCLDWQAHKFLKPKSEGMLMLNCQSSYESMPTLEFASIDMDADGKLDKKAGNVVAGIVLTMLVDGQPAFVKLLRRFEEQAVQVVTELRSVNPEEKDFCEFQVRKVPFGEELLEEVVLSDVIASNCDASFTPAYQASLVIAEQLNEALDKKAGSGK